MENTDVGLFKFRFLTRTANIICQSDERTSTPVVISLREVFVKDLVNVLVNDKNDKNDKNVFVHHFVNDFVNTKVNKKSRSRK